MKTFRQVILEDQGLTFQEWCLHFIAGFAAGGAIVGVINLIYLAYRSIIA